MKRLFSKTIIITVIALICFNAIFPCVSSAKTSWEWREYIKKEIDTVIYQKIKELKNSGDTNIAEALADDIRKNYQYILDEKNFLNQMLINALDETTEEGKITVDQAYYVFNTVIGQEYYAEILNNIQAYIDNYEATIGQEDPTVEIVRVIKNEEDFKKYVLDGFLLENAYNVESEEERIAYIQKFKSNWVDEIKGKFQMEYSGRFTQETCNNMVKKYINELNELSATEPTPTGNSKDPIGNQAGGVLDGVLGILLYPLKLGFIIPAILIKLVTFAVAGENATLYTIFFNEGTSEITNINIFEPAKNPTIDGMRNAIAEFYVSFRNLAIVLSLAVLVYIGIRMAISNIAEERAKYKSMLSNWAVGFALIFVMHFIIIFTINANNLLIDALKSSNMETANFMNSLLAQAWWIPLSISFGSIIMYIGLQIITLIFLIVYIKRMITISFLIVISPLISITYSIDKIGNNKSEILNRWIKEFLYNVLIQPFHCILYLVYIGTAMSLLTDSGNFGAVVFALVYTFSIFSAQKLIRSIFGFEQSGTLTEKVAIIAMTKNVVSNVKGIVALKGSKNDENSKKAENKIKGLTNAMPGGEELNGKNMTELRMKAAEHNKQEKAEEKAKKKGKNIPIKSINNKVHKRRRLKNKPKIVRKAGRLYGKALSRITGYQAANNAMVKRKQSRRDVRHMKDKDYAIAISESYRQAVNPNMSNKELADEFERIRTTSDTSKWTEKEWSYKMMMDAAKIQFNLSDSDIKDAILNGTKDDRRWS